MRRSVTFALGKQGSSLAKVISGDTHSLYDKENEDGFKTVDTIEVDNDDYSIDHEEEKHQINFDEKQLNQKKSRNETGKASLFGVILSKGLSKKMKPNSIIPSE